LPPALIESELLDIRKDHLRGNQNQKWIIDAAEGGTLFLDEIGELP
jgi:transcriptional regulator with PAS, ATPase and Fis domain